MAIFLGVGPVVMAVGFGPSGFLLAFLIDVFARFAHRVEVVQRSVRSLLREPERKRFSLIADTSEARPIYMACQTQQDSSLLAAELEDCLPGTIREGKIKGPERSDRQAQCVFCSFHPSSCHASVLLFVKGSCEQLSMHALEPRTEWVAQWLGRWSKAA